jgi:hypothetical protein
VVTFIVPGFSGTVFKSVSGENGLVVNIAVNRRTNRSYEE